MTAPLANGALYDSAQVEEFLNMLFRNVDWLDGEVISLLGIGEKGTAQEGVFRDRQIIPPGFMGLAHGHLKRWAEHHVAGFIVPAVLKPAAKEKGDVTLDKVAALTAIILDIDSGDVPAKLAFVVERLGQPTMTVASGGTTAEGATKIHAYWLFNKPCEDVERVAALRKQLAAKVGGDQSFGRATQVIRVPGSVHAKNGKAALCSILARSTAEYSLDELADTIENMSPMPGLPAPVQPNLPALTGGMMDFSPRTDTAIAALHRDINEGGDELTRWGEFSKIAGFHISEARAGRIQPQAAIAAANGWMLTHMNPPWPQARFDQEFTALVNKDIANHGDFPQSVIARSTPSNLPTERFADIEPSLSNNWLVHDLIPAAGLALIYGNPGAGKSFFAIDVAINIAAGRDVNGAEVRQGVVLYVAAEAAAGVRNRISAFRKHHSVDPAVPFTLVPVAIDLLDARNLPLLFEAVDKEVHHYRCAPAAIFVDTISATFGAGDENGKDMTAYLGNLARVRDRYGATVIAIHHRPKDQTNDTPRGHSSLIGGLDASIIIERGAELRTASVRKQKDAPDGTPPISFDLLSVELGMDEKGRPVSSAVVVYRERKASDKISADTQLVLNSLIKAIERGEENDASEAEWRRVWEELTPEKLEEARRKGFSRGRKNLLEGGRIERVAGRWSIVSATVAGPTAMMNFDPLAMAA